MKFILRILIAALTVGVTVNSASLTVERGSDLQAVINIARDGDTLLLAAKEFSARGTEFVEPLCGNCADPQTEVPASYGFILKGKSLNIIGLSRDSTRLITNAGYGFYFEDSPDSRISNLTITGGKRDPDGNATDAGIVVRRSRVTIEGVDIINNNHRIDSVVVGIGGIFGREQADLYVRDCSIINGGWDGIALYRGASAVVEDCLIKDGRGAGIGVTWDATCRAWRNEVTGFWKGIGAFGNSWVVARNNLVHNNLGWGIIATGRSYMDITNNVVHHNGNCGIAPWSTDCHGRIVNNVIAENGWRDQWVCPCVGVWNYGDWAKWDFSYNILFENVAGDYDGIWDQSGLKGNRSIDPMFVGEGDFHFKEGSPGIHGGDTLIFNADGSVSHIGLYGGPQAWK
ncbi:MAG: right-handed parallel beta-helix repeat-containing protein [bacterium]|nr:right-handed parallel beta-helix repeat-containing protein [bacterium]